MDERRDLRVRAFLPTVIDSNMKMTTAARIANAPRAAVLWSNLVTGHTAYWYINSGGSITGAYIPAVPDSELGGPRGRGED